MSQAEDESFAMNDLKLNLQDQKTVNREELKSLILQYQNQQEKGYYTFNDWGSLHNQMFGVNQTQLPQTILNLWRVLKLINFGDDFIPTGLIYDTLVTLMLIAVDSKTETDKNKSLEEVQTLLRSIFFKFIEFNGKYLSEEQKQELAFFKIIRTVAEGYRSIIFSNFDQNKKGYVQTQMSRNQQLYKMHDVFVYKKNLQKLKKIQEQFKQCTFQPDLSYTSRSIMAQSRYMDPPKKKNHQLAHSHLLAHPEFVIPEEEYDQDRLFRANPVPQYPEANPVGVSEHLERMQRSREIKKINSVRAYSSQGQSGKKTVKQFGIEQRDRERKEKMLKSFKILFMIKVEVAKRIYRVKVRQNMGVSDVVKAIEMMVGFKHPDIDEIVKGYFINYEMKQNLAQGRGTITQFSYEEDC